MLSTTLSSVFWAIPVSGHIAILGAGFFLGKKIYDITQEKAPHYTSFQPDFVAPLFHQNIESEAQNSLGTLATSRFCRVADDWSIKAISLQE